MEKELVYLLGYFYADGYLNHKKHKYPRLDMIKCDTENLINCLNKLNTKYSITYRFRSNSKNEQACINILSADTNINLFREILSDKINMINILRYINKKDLCYFLRGFFDGDGCISICKLGSGRLYFYGSFDQNWSLVFDVLKDLNIKYSYQQIIRKNTTHKSSHVFISNKHGINILYEYLYPKRFYDFGLFRKYEKLNSVKSLIKSKHIIRYKENQTCVPLKIYNNC